MEQLFVKLKSPGKIARNCLKGAPGLSSSSILDDLQSAKLVLTIMASILILGLLGPFSRAEMRRQL